MGRIMGRRSIRKDRRLILPRKVTFDTPISATEWNAMVDYLISLTALGGTGIRVSRGTCGTVFECDAVLLNSGAKFSGRAYVSGKRIDGLDATANLYVRCLNGAIPTAEENAGPPPDPQPDG